MKHPFQIGPKSVSSVAALSCLAGLFLSAPSSALAAIGDAVDAPSLTWTTGGGANWFSQTTNTHDGVDAAATGFITNSQDAWIETSVTGPGTLVFWWKVSSEYDLEENVGYDTLEFYTNGSSPFVEGIGGEVDWQLRSLTLPAGTNVLRWSYIKDGSDDYPVGQDRAWLDQVSFFTNSFPPIVSTHPENQSAPLGNTVEFKVESIGSAPLQYQWRRDGTNLTSSGNVSGAHSSTLTLTSIGTGDLDRDYSVVVENAQGSVTSLVATLSLAPTLAEAVDTLGLIWSTGGDQKWRGQTNTTHDGTDAAQAGPIQNNENSEEVSWLETTVVGPGELRFWWRVSSEFDYDFFEFSTNGILDVKISGDSGWQQVTRLFEAGPHTLRWQWHKDQSVSGWLDTAWLDQVSFGSPAPQPFILSPAGSTGGLLHITLQGEPDRTYRLYSSSNLLDWVPVQTNSDPSGVVPFSNFATGGNAQRYYRGETDSN